MISDRMMPVQHVADKMGMKRSTIYKYIREGSHFDLSKVKQFPNGYRIPESEVDRVMSSFPSVEELEA